MFAARQRDFQSRLGRFLENETIAIADYPQLRLLCWNRREPYLSAREAWELYDRNWRFVETGSLDTRERELIRSLAARFGDEVLHA